jgi:uncharacterized membrane protein
MDDWVHRYAPSESSARLTLAVVLAAVGTPVLGFALWALSGVMQLSLYPGFPASVLLFLVGSLALWVSLALGRGLAREADAAPREANPTVTVGDGEKTESDVDPIVTLQRRYAEGDLSDEAFERRMDRLLESDGRRADAGRERKSESALNR